MKTKTKVIIGILSFAVLTGISIAFYVRFDLYTPIQREEEKKAFEIKEGVGVEEIVDSLKSEGFVRNRWVIFGYLKIKGYGSKLKAGTYLLDKKNSPVETIDIIVSGETALQKITILEGWGKAEIAEYLEDKGIVSHDDFFMSLTKKWDYDFTKNLQDLEGYLYPDTYYIPYNSTADDITKILLNNFDKKLTDELKEEIENQGKTVNEIVTMASIVEKEVFGEEDRKIVAGIFWARILEETSLQSDATINYITGENNPTPTYSQTRQDSPYNTYTNRGLPPGPICNPSIESIEAAIYPEKTNYRYYLNRQDTGETIFSTTYDEHLDNKYKYLK